MRDGTDHVLLLGGLRSQGTAEIVPGEDSQNVGEDKRYSPVIILNTHFPPDGPSIPLQHFVFQSCAIHLVGQLIVTGGGTQFHQYVDRWPFDLARGKAPVVLLLKDLLRIVHSLCCLQSLGEGSW